jgi:hypothetical protein
VVCVCVWGGGVCMWVVLCVCEDSDSELLEIGLGIERTMK